MKKVVVTVVTLFCVTCATSALAKGLCQFWEGEGATGYYWKDGSRRILRIRRAGHVALRYVCGSQQPKVNVPRKYRSKLRVSVLLVKDVAPSGNTIHVWQIHFLWRAKVIDRHVAIPVKIETEKRTFHVKVEVAPDVESAMVLANDASKRADEAAANADEAKNTIRKTREVGVSMDIAGFRSFETAGKPGWGTSLTVSGIFFRFHKMWALAAAGRLSWQRYEMEVIGTNLVNTDVNGDEYDMFALLQLHLKPAWWFRAHLELGFGLRVFDHPDAVTVQDQNFYIRGTEGRVDSYGLFALGLGIRFKPHKRIAFGIFYQLDVTLGDAVDDASGDPAVDPVMIPVVNHKLGLNVSVEY